MLAERFLTLIWNRVPGKHQPFLRIQDVFVLISEIEKFLSVRNLLIKEEIRLLTKMIQEKPNLRLFRKGLNTFLITLVHFPSINEWLSSRGKVQEQDLMILVRHHERIERRFENQLFSRPSLSFEPYSKGQENDSKYNLNRKYYDLKHVSQESKYDPNDLKYGSSSKYDSSNGLSRIGTVKDEILGEKPGYHEGNTLPPLLPGSYADEKVKQEPVKDLLSWFRFGSKTRSGSKLNAPMTESKKQEYKDVDVTKNRDLHEQSELEKLIHNQKILIRNLENRLYGESTSFSIYRLLKANKLTKHLPIIRNIDSESFSAVHAVTQIGVFIFASMAALAFLISGVFLTLKLMRLVIFILESMASREDSDDEVPFTWIQEYPWLEYQLYSIYDTLGF